MTTRMTKARTYNSEIIKDLLSGTSADELRLTEKKMLLAVKIADAVKKKYRHQNDFAAAMGKKPSEISKWLSGTHNFTTETLFEIERVLEIRLINLESKPASYITYHISLKAPAERTESFYNGRPAEGDKFITTYKGESIVSETKQEYVTS